MSKAVLIAIRPEWCEKIVPGEKTIEVRKTRPKLPTPFKCYIYKTIGNALRVWEEGKFVCKSDTNGKVIGEFVCDKIQKTFEPAGGLVDVIDCEQSCLTASEIISYAGGEALYFWHISDLKIYDKPKALSEFLKPCPYGDVSCFLCDKSGYTPEMKIDCCNNVTRPPQSWCYVEDVQ